MIRICGHLQKTSGQILGQMMKKDKKSFSVA